MIAVLFTMLLDVIRSEVSEKKYVLSRDKRTSFINWLQSNKKG